MTALGTRQSNLEILTGLKANEKIVYTQNGNRSRTARATLKHLTRVLPKVGVTRIAEISQLSPHAYPVFQSARPRILYHSHTGQNTGAQGKGATPEQAKISCMMETIESYCLEPRQEQLIRGSYQFLSQHHVIAHPQLFALQNQRSVSVTDALMWTEAVSLETAQSVLVPAEAVYFPFLPRDYATEPNFVTGSNGVGAGSTYLEATIHALYEVIERHYFALWELGRIKAKSFITASLDHVAEFKSLRHSMAADFDIEIVSLEMTKTQNIPMLMCWLVGKNGPWFFGASCCANVQIAFERALSEAIQGYAVKSSGAREDMSQGGCVTKLLERFPKYQTLDLTAYTNRQPQKKFMTLHSECIFLLQWLRAAGFRNVFIANLTRVGVDIPVVKVLVSGLLPMQDHRHGLQQKTQDIHDLRYCRVSA